MKYFYKHILIIVLALFFSLNKVEAQTGSGLDTLTLINGWQLVEYSSGVTYAKTWFTNIDPYHGIYSQLFEIDRNSPNVANDREYYAIFRKKLPKRINKTEFFQFSLKYSHSVPNLGIESPLLDFAVGNNGAISVYKNIVNIKNDIWTNGPQVTPQISSDSIDCLYLRVSGNFKQTYFQVDYFTFVEPTTGLIFDVIEDFEDNTIVGVKDEPFIPTNFALSQNYPNPFNPETTIKFQISNSAHVNLKLFDLLGREIETLVNEGKYAGTYEVKFIGSNLASGIYFYRLDVGHGRFVQTRKMIYLK